MIIQKGGVYMKQKLCIIGSGWRGQFILKAALAMPDRFDIGGIVTRDGEKAKMLRETYGVPVYADYMEMIKTEKPDFTCVAASTKACPEIAVELAKIGMPVLMETAYLDDINAQIEFYQAIGKAPFQFLEQYHLQPIQQARSAIVASGLIGDVFEAQVSQAQCYHGISVMRKLLGVTFEDVTIRATTFEGKLIGGPGRGGDPEKEEIKKDLQTLGWFDFGDKFGVFDNTQGQIRSWVRSCRTLVFGDRGEINGDQLRWLEDYKTPMMDQIKRFSIGQQECLEGIGFKNIQAAGRVWYKNPFEKKPLIDDAIAVATCLEKMGDYVAGGPSFYSLADGLQDQYLSRLMEQAADTGSAVKSEKQIWAE